MDSVSALRQRARDEIDQMDEDALRRVMPALSRERRRRAAEMEDDMEERMAAYRRLREFAESIPPGTDIDAVVREEMGKEHLSPLEMVRNTVPCDVDSIDWGKYGKRTSTRSAYVGEYMEEMRGDRQIDWDEFPPPGNRDWSVGEYMEEMRGGDRL